MELNEYQRQAMTTCVKESKNPMYMLFGLSEEIGELHGKIAKAIRKGWIRIDDNQLLCSASLPQEWQDAIIKEAGDCLWMLAGAASVMGYDLERIAQRNLDKLRDRRQRNTIVGEGDDR